MTATPATDWYVEFSFAVPDETIAPETNMEPTGRRVELFRDGPGGVLAVVPGASDPDEALEWATALLSKAWSHFDFPGEVPPPWQVRTVNRPLQYQRFLNGQAKAEETLTDGTIVSDTDKKKEEQA